MRRFVMMPRWLQLLAGTAFGVLAISGYLAARGGADDRVANADDRVSKDVSASRPQVSGASAADRLTDSADPASSSTLRAAKPAPVETGSVDKAKTTGGAIAKPSAAPIQPRVIDQVSAQKTLFSDKVSKLKALYAKKAYAAALPLAEEVLVEAEALYGTLSAEAHGSAFNLGTLYNLTGQPDKAVPVLQRAFESERAAGAPSSAGYQRVFKELLKSLRRSGQSETALKLIEAVLDELRIEAPEDRKTLAGLLEMQGGILRRLARFADALQTLKLARGLKQEIYGARSGKLVSVHNQIAGVQKVRGAYKAAEASYLEAIAILRRSKESANLAIVLDNLAVLYLGMGRAKDAEPVQKEALAIAERQLGPEHPTVGQVIANLATLYEALNRYGDAEKLFLRALRIWEGRIPPNDRRLGITYDNLAGTYREQGKLGLARDTYEMAVANITANYPPQHPEVATALNNLALAELALKNTSSARKLIEKSLSITAAALGEDHVAYAVGLGNLGDVKAAAGDDDGANKAYLSALDIISRTLGPTHKRAIFPLRELGRIAYRNKDIPAALGYFRQAAEAEIDNARVNPGDQGVLHRGVFHWLLATLWQAGASGDLAPQPMVREAFEQIQWATLTSAGSAINKLAVRQAARDPRLAELVRKRQDLAQALAAGDSTLLEAAAKPLRERDRPREAKLRGQLADLKRAFDRVDRDIGKAFPEFADLSSPRPLDAETTLSLLAPSEVLVFAVVEASYTHVFLVEPTADKPFVWRRVTIKREALRDMVQTLRCGLDGGAWAGIRGTKICEAKTGGRPKNGRLPFRSETAQRLFETLFGPLAPSLEGRHVLIAANDVLAGLPFQVLLRSGPKDEDLRQADWFGLANPISVYPTVAALKSLRADVKQTAATRAYLGVANPLLTGAQGGDRSAWGRASCQSVRERSGRRIALGDTASSLALRSASQLSKVNRTDLDLVERVRRLAPLPETADEVCAVADMMGRSRSRVLLGPQATETELRVGDIAGELKDYRIVHFATHGLVSGEVSGLAEPALVLTPPPRVRKGDDGLLTASDVAGLSFDADWVVLSACNTAAGEAKGGEALSGLARSFFYAGARSLLVSHWPVESDAAVLLTTRALDELRRNPGLGRAEALRRAIAEMIENGGPDAAHPQVWAPFSIVGEGGALNGFQAGRQSVRPPLRDDVVAVERTTPARATRGAPVPFETDVEAKAKADAEAESEAEGLASSAPDRGQDLGEDLGEDRGLGRGLALLPPIRKPDVPQSFIDQRVQSRLKKADAAASGSAAQSRQKAVAARRKPRRVKPQPKPQAKPKPKPKPKPAPANANWGDRYWENRL